MHEAAKARLLSAGAVGTAIAASVCCTGPLALALLGLGGGVVLLRLAPYRPYLLVGTAILLLSAFYLTYARPKVAVCGPDSACARPRRKGQEIALAISTILVLLAAAFPYFVDLLF